MELTTMRPRVGAYNFDDLYYRGLDVGALMLQLTQGNNNMPTSSIVSTVTERYTANASGTGYLAGQTIGRTELVDLSTTPPSSTVYWFNYTTGTSLTVSPVYSTLTLNAQGGITNAELRATPLLTRTDLSSPELTRMGDVTDAMAAADGSGTLTVLAGLRRMVNSLNSVMSRLPASLGQKTASGSISVVQASDTWENSGLQFDVNGNITRETQTNGTITRYRLWTTTVDTLGVTTNSAGAWI